MDQSIIAIIIVVIAVISFALEKIPLAVTAVLAAVAMGIFGIIDVTDVYASFGSLATVMVASMMVLGTAIFDNGIAQAIGNKVVSLKFIKTERSLIVVLVSLAIVLSAFLSNSAVIAMMIPLIGTVALTSKGKITNKNVLMAAGMGAGAGGFLTLAGSTPQLIAQEFLIDTPGLTPMVFFELAKAGLIPALLMVIYFGTVGYRLQKKVLTFPDVNPIASSTDNAYKETSAANDAIGKPKEYMKWKQVVTSIVVIATLIGFISGIWDFAVVGLLGASILILTGVISVRRALNGIDWNTIVILSASQAFAKGIETSGADQLITNSIISIFGNNATPFIILAAMIVTVVILTNFMSSTATAAMFLPIAISMANTLDVSPETYVMGVVIAAQVAFFTPIGTPCVTQTLVGGYRYMDYVKVGLPISIIMTIVLIFMVPFVYGF